jgi:hypothetical protein
MKTNLTNLLLIGSFFLLHTAGLAQGPYLYLGGGYGMPMGAQNLSPIGMINYTVDPELLEVERISRSFGQGTNFEAGAGYMFTENFGAELAFSYLFSDRFEATQVSYGSITTPDYYLEYTRTNNVDFRARMFRLSPALVFSSGTGNVRPFARFGLVIGTGNIYIDEYYVTAYKHISLHSGHFLNWKVNGELAIGTHAGIGTLVRLGNRLSLVGELKAVNMSWSPLKNELYKATFNGRDILEEFSRYEKEMEFVDRYTERTGQEPDQSKPRQALKQNLPFGSIGMNLAIRFDL